jgi:hypothetical protein
MVDEDDQHVIEEFISEVLHTEQKEALYDDDELLHIQKIYSSLNES